MTSKRINLTCPGTLFDPGNPQGLIPDQFMALKLFDRLRMIPVFILLFFNAALFAQEGTLTNKENGSDIQYTKPGEKPTAIPDNFNRWDTLAKYRDSKALKQDGFSSPYYHEKSQIQLALGENQHKEFNPSGFLPAPYGNGLSTRPNQVFIGASYINIDNSGKGNNGYGSFGVTGEFTRNFTQHVGATIDGGIYFHKETQNDLTDKYTQWNITVGPSYIPFKNPPSENNKLSGNVHALFGLASISIKESSGSYGIDQISKQGFTAMIGGALDYRLKPNMGIRVQADYAPTVFFNTTQNNVRVSAGVVVGFGGVKTITTATTTTDSGPIVVDSVQNQKECKASKTFKELKISFAWFEFLAESLEKIANKIPRVEAKITVNTQVSVKQGEECCSKDKPPVNYTEFKGGVEGSCEINVNLYGLPDINYSIKLWPILLIAEFKAKVFMGPTGKTNIDPVGRYYGDLGKNDRPDCKSCYYLVYKTESYARGGITLGGKVKVFHWMPFGGGKAGFDVTGEPDSEIEVSGEASLSFGATFTGTYGLTKECAKPPLGLHGEMKIGKLKANLKIKIKVGPLSVNPNWEFDLYDGIKFDY